MIVQDSPLVEPHSILFGLDDCVPVLEVQCPFRFDDPERPCAMFDPANPDRPRRLLIESGCGLEHWLEHGGLESIGVTGEIVAAAVHVDLVGWEPDGGPIIEARSSRLQRERDEAVMWANRFSAALEKIMADDQARANEIAVAEEGVVAIDERDEAVRLAGRYRAAITEARAALDGVTQ